MSCSAILYQSIAQIPLTIYRKFMLAIGDLSKLKSRRYHTANQGEPIPGRDTCSDNIKN
jgi:hypothetical protein